MYVKINYFLKKAGERCTTKVVVNCYHQSLNSMLLWKKERSSFQNRHGWGNLEVHIERSREGCKVHRTYKKLWQAKLFEVSWETGLCRDGSKKAMGKDEAIALPACGFDLGPTVDVGYLPAGKWEHCGNIRKEGWGVCETRCGAVTVASNWL